MAHSLRAPRPEESILARIRKDAEERERRETVDAVIKAGGNLAKAARMVGISRGGMVYRAQKYGLLESEPGKNGGLRGA